MSMEIRKNIKIKPENVRIPVFMPGNVNPLEAIDIDDRMRFVYSGLIMADTIDGYLVELELDTKRCGLYKQSFKASLNEMKRSIERYKSIMYKSVCITDSAREELVNNLDTLDDELNNDMRILFHSIKRYVQKFVSDTDHATCIARCSLIDILSSYSIMNDQKMSRILSNFTFRDLSLEDKNIKAISFQSRKYIGAFASLYGNVDIDLNDCEEIYMAFSIMDKKMSKVHEFLKQTA